jgi:hypothetical protein
MIETRMPGSVEELPEVRLADGLGFETTTDGFRLATPFQIASYADLERAAYLGDLGTMIAAGGSTASELALIAFYRHGMPAATTLAMLESMLAGGLMNEQTR